MKKNNNIKRIKKQIGIGIMLGTVVLMTGCSSDLQKKFGEEQEIEIEIAIPEDKEQGEEVSALLWEELASLETNPELRKEWDNILGIVNTDVGKNGVLYVNDKGENDNNNTLKIAIHNKEFTDLLENETEQIKLSEAVANQYADVEVDEDSLVINKNINMGINGYFNLLPDAEPDYSNPDSTLTRNEFMAMVFRSETPVKELEAKEDFNTAVGESKYNLYSQEIAQDNYLTTEDKSLNNQTINGTISRAEALYLLMNHYFKEDLQKVDLKGTEVEFTDAKDGGDIAGKQKFTTDKPYWKSYELVYAIQNPDNGLPTELYKALVLAEDKGLIDKEADTRWDEGITKSEAIGLLLHTLQKDSSITPYSYKQGTLDGYTSSYKPTTDEDDGTGVQVDCTGNDVTFEEGEYRGDDEEEEVTKPDEPDPSENTEKTNTGIPNIVEDSNGKYEYTGTNEGVLGVINEFKNNGWELSNQALKTMAELSDLYEKGEGKESDLNHYLEFIRERENPNNNKQQAPVNNPAPAPAPTPSPDCPVPVEGLPDQEWHMPEDDGSWAGVHIS